MDYLLIDARQRYLGTINSGKALSVGDHFQDQQNRSFTVIGVNWSRKYNSPMQSLTVVPIHQRVTSVENQVVEN